MRRLPLPFLLLLALSPAFPLRAQDPPPPDPFQTHVRAGEAAARSGLPLAAAREYRAALAYHPADAAAHYALAGVLEQAGRTDDALAEYEATVRLDPADAAAHNALGMLLEDRGRRDAALAQYRQATALSPNDARLRFNLAAALEAAGQGASARAEYQAALRLDPSLAEARAALREGESTPAHVKSPALEVPVYFGVKVPAGLKTRPRRLLLSAGGTSTGSRPALPVPGHPADTLPRALALEAAGRLPEAVWAFHVLLARDPADAAARLHLGIVLYAQGQTVPARQQWARVQSGPDADAARRARRLLALYP